MDYNSIKAKQNIQTTDYNKIQPICTMPVLGYTLPRMVTYSNCGISSQKWGNTVGWGISGCICMYRLTIMTKSCTPKPNCELPHPTPNTGHDNFSNTIVIAIVMQLRSLVYGPVTHLCVSDLGHLGLFGTKPLPNPILFYCLSDILDVQWSLNQNDLIITKITHLKLSSATCSGLKVLTPVVNNNVKTPRLRLF